MTVCVYAQKPKEILSWSHTNFAKSEIRENVLLPLGQVTEPPTLFIHQGNTWRFYFDLPFLVTNSFTSEKIRQVAFCAVTCIMRAGECLGVVSTLISTTPLFVGTQSKCETWCTGQMCCRSNKFLSSCRKYSIIHCLFVSFFPTCKVCESRVQEFGHRNNESGPTRGSNTNFSQKYLCKCGKEHDFLWSQTHVGFWAFHCVHRCTKSAFWCIACAFKWFMNEKQMHDYACHEAVALCFPGQMCKALTKKPHKRVSDGKKGLTKQHIGNKIGFSNV